MIVKQKEELLSYLEDTSNIKGEACSLYIPENRDEVVEVVNDCIQKDTPFTVSGGRTGTTGGCVPLKGSIVSLERLDRIVDIDQDKRIVKAESGVSLEKLEKEINRFNFTLRAAPTESLALIGGVVSTSASGVRGVGHGSIRKYVAGLEIVLPGGQLLQLKRGDLFSKGRVFDFNYQDKRFNFNLPSYNMPAVKSQAGYFVSDDMDLIDLFIGSEGTLGVVTCCDLLIQQCPFDIFDGLVFFSHEKGAFDFVEKVRQSLLKPASLEFLDNNSLEFLRPEYASFIPVKAKSAVYFEQEVEDKEDFNPLLDRWAVIVEESGVSLDNSIFADTPKMREKLFEFRHKLPQKINEFLRHVNQVKVASDIAVPAKVFPQMYDFYQKCGEESGIDYVNFGHIGEFHLHFNFLPRNNDENSKARKYLEAFCRKAVSLGGTVSAEHGIGKIKKPYLKIMYNEERIKEMAAVKKYFDPHCLLGLDNIFNKEYLYV